MKKRILAALLAAVLYVGMMPAAQAVQTYSDVPVDHWSAESVYRATELGIFNGIGNGLFGRGQAISRAAFVTALVRLFGWELVETEKASFADVTADRWFYSAVETAVANGAIPVSSQNFRPDDTLKRGDMAAMMIRALGYTSLAGTVNNLDCPFADVTVNKGFITMAHDLGLVSGMGDGSFAPNSAATREQAATILVRLYDKLNAQSKLLSGAGSRVTLALEPAKAKEGDELPTTPLEPIAQLYEQLRALKSSGQTMEEVVLALRAGGVRTITSDGGKIVFSEAISELQVRTILARKDVRLYYSTRYESAYCVYQPNFYQTVTVWYQSEESLAAKLQLARMFGVSDYVLQ